MIAETLQQVQAERKETPRGKNTRPDLLFIDDNALVRETVKTLLQQKYHEVLTTDDVFTGLCLLAVHRPFNILIDAGMRGLSGNHFCALVKSLLPFRSTRLIILLQGDDDLARARALAAGADAVLIKPFGKEELLTLMVDRSSKAA